MGRVNKESPYEGNLGKVTESECGKKHTHNGHNRCRPGRRNKSKESDIEGQEAYEISLI